MITQEAVSGIDCFERGIYETNGISSLNDYVKSRS